MGDEKQSVLENRQGESIPGRNSPTLHVETTKMLKIETSQATARVIESVVLAPVEVVCYNDSCVILTLDMQFSKMCSIPLPLTPAYRSGSS